MPIDLNASSVTEWNPEWSMFCRDHSSWFVRLDDRQPLLAIPDAALKVLESPRMVRGKATFIFDAQTIESEKCFTNLCHRTHAIGVDRNRPVQHPYIALKNNGADALASMLKSLPDGWTEAARRAATAATSRADSTIRDLKRYVGALISDPSYLEELAAIQQAWTALPEDIRPRIALARSGRFFADDQPVSLRATESQMVSPSEVEFTRALNAFLDRWGLMGLATWDLPLPQGPLLPAMNALQIMQTPGAAVHIALTAWQNPGRELVEELREHLAIQAESHDLPNSSKRIQLCGKHASFLEIHYLRLALRSRFTEKPPLGFSGAFKDVVARVLGIQEDHANTLIKNLSASRRDGVWSERSQKTGRDSKAD